MEETACEPIAASGPLAAGIQVLTTFEESREALARLAGQRVGLDIETTGLDPLMDRVRLLQVAAAGQPTLLIDLFQAGDLGGFKSEIETLRPVCHNALFELGFMQQSGISMLPDCTMLAGHCISGRRESLGDLAARILGQQLDKSYQKSDWSGELSEEQLWYAATDARVTLQLWDILEQVVEDCRLGLVYRLQRNAQLAVTAMQLRGMSFDSAKHTSLVERLQEKRDRLLTELLEAIGGRNPRSAQQLGAWLADKLPDDAQRTWPTTPGGRLSTSTAVFKEQNLPPAIARDVGELLLPYKLVAKQVEAFGEGLKHHIHPFTGRIHASFSIAGPVTGRMACARPNLQQIPRGPDFRVLFTAPPGRALVIGDFSQIELRVAAMLADEQALLAAYHAGVDVHALTAALILGKPEEAVTKEERQLAKAVNFGLLFGQGAPGLQAYAGRTYGVKMTLQEAAAYRAAWHRAYPAFGRWHEKTAAEARHYLSVKTPAGRWRRWTPETFRITAAFNTPVQGGAAEIMLAALGELMRELLRSGLDVVPVAVVHDEVILEAAEQHAVAARDLLTRVMIAGAQIIFPDICTRNLVDPGIVQSWSEK